MQRALLLTRHPSSNHSTSITHNIPDSRNVPTPSPTIPANLYPKQPPSKQPALGNSLIRVPRSLGRAEPRQGRNQGVCKVRKPTTAKEGTLRIGDQSTANGPSALRHVPRIRRRIVSRESGLCARVPLRDQKGPFGPPRAAGAASGAMWCGGCGAWPTAGVPCPIFSSFVS